MGAEGLHRVRGHYVGCLIWKPGWHTSTTSLSLNQLISLKWLCAAVVFPVCAQFERLPRFKGCRRNGDSRVMQAEALAHLSALLYNISAQATDRIVFFFLREMDSRTVLLLLGTVALVCAKGFQCDTASACDTLVTAVYQKFTSPAVNISFNVNNSTS